MKVEQVPARDWKEWVEANNAQVIDVREPHEWATGTLPGAIRLSLGTLPYQLHSLDRDRPLLLVCASGNRSNHAAAFLAQAGWERVANLAGGMQDVVPAGI